MRRLFPILFLGLAFVALACSETALPIQRESNLTIGPLNFQSGLSGLSVTKASMHYRNAFQTAAGYSAAVFVELEKQSETSGTYSVNSTYSTIQSFVNHMNSQSSLYTWESVAGDFVFVYPAAGSMLSTTVGDSLYKDVVFCSLIKEIAAEHFPSQEGSGCMYMSMGRKRPTMIPAGIQGVSGSSVGEFTISVPGSSTRVLDLFVAAVGKAQRRFSATGMRSAEDHQPLWALIF